MVDNNAGPPADISTPLEVPYRQIADYESGWIEIVDGYDPGPVFPYDDPHPEMTAWAKGVLLRAAAFETGAVENMYASRDGATITIAAEEDGWEATLREAGEDAPRAFEDILAAYTMVDRERDDERLITAASLRELHKVACASQTHYSTDRGDRELHHGVYKTDPNHTALRGGLKRSYCDPYLVDSEVTAAFDLYRRIEDMGAPAAILSAFLHWAFAHIHPFEDGNGRTARIFASVPLLRRHEVPVMVFADAKQTYFQALASADAGRPFDMWKYTEARVSDAMRWREQLILEHTTPDVASQADVIAQILAAQTAPREPDDVIETRVRELFLARMLRDLQAVEQLGFEIADTSSIELNSFVGAVKGIRMEAPFHLTLILALEARAEASSVWAEVRVLGEMRNGPGLGHVSLQLHDCTPQLSNEARIRIDLAGKIAARAITDRLTSRITEAARALGTLPDLPP